MAGFLAQTEGETLDQLNHQPGAGRILYQILQALPNPIKYKMLYRTLGLRVAEKEIVGRCSDPRYPNGTLLVYADVPQRIEYAQGEYMRDSSRFNVSKYLDPYKFWIDVESGEWCNWGLNHRRWFPYELLRNQSLDEVLALAESAVAKDKDKSNA